jgi:hypothetical protein
MVPSARPSGLDEAVFDPERGTARTSLASERCTRGISDHSTPSSSRPPAFGVRPPHCLKKNANTHSLATVVGPRDHRDVGVAVDFAGTA